MIFVSRYKIFKFGFVIYTTLLSYNLCLVSLKLCLYSYSLCLDLLSNKNKNGQLSPLPI